MQEPFQPDLDFEAVADADDEGAALVIDIDGFEGPLHVLLALARAQKVDLLKLSITSLADQYLAFVREAGRRNFALVADYLVMASWLAYLKSRLLLPKPERKNDDEPPAELLQETLRFRLIKLEAMRKASETLMARPRLGIDVFARGDPDATVVIPSSTINATLFELMEAYIIQRKKTLAHRYDPGKRAEAYPLEAARTHLRTLAPSLKRWTALWEAVPFETANAQGLTRASAAASTLSASLELIKDGVLEAQQEAPFADLYLRAKAELTAESRA